MKNIILILALLISGNLFAGTIGNGDCPGFPDSLDSLGIILLPGQRATSNYANDVKQCIIALETFLFNAPYFRENVSTLKLLVSSGAGTNMINDKLGIGFGTSVENKLQVNGNISCTGLFTSSSPGQNYFSGFTVSSGVVSSGQLHSRIATGTPPLTVESTTKVTNLNSDLIEGYHVYISSKITVTGVVGTEFTTGNFATGLSTIYNVVGSIDDSDAGLPYVYFHNNGSGNVTVTFLSNTNFLAQPISFHFVAYGN